MRRYAALAIMIWAFLSVVPAMALPIPGVPTGDGIVPFAYDGNWNSDIRIEKNKIFLEKLAMLQFGVADRRWVKKAPDWHCVA